MASDYIIVVAKQPASVVCNMTTNQALRFKSHQQANTFLWKMDALLVLQLTVMEVPEGMELSMIPQSKREFANEQGDFDEQE